MAPAGDVAPENFCYPPCRQLNFHASSALLHKIRDLFALFRKQYDRHCLQRFLDTAHCLQMPGKCYFPTFYYMLNTKIRDYMLNTKTMTPSCTYPRYNSWAEMNSLISRKHKLTPLKMEAHRSTIAIIIDRTVVKIIDLCQCAEGRIVYAKICTEIHMWQGSLVSLFSCTEIQLPYKLSGFICCRVSHLHTPGIHTPDCRRPRYIPFMKI